MDKYECFNNIKKLLTTHKCEIDKEKEINYGLQFNISCGEQEGVFRIYDGKKGIKLDASQIKDEDFKAFIEGIVGLSPSKSLNKKSSNKKTTPNIIDPEELIGIDESGKGDYFGPLVIAGVYVDAKTSKRLREKGVIDSKQLNDNKIKELAILIKELCPYDIVVVRNEKYNEMYDSIGNLNVFLAWGHARVIENMLERIDCEYVLSDQFGRPELIQSALMEKGKKIQLSQRPKAESNIAVAAASILARNAFVSKLDDLEKLTDMTLPKGASKKVIQSGILFAERYGMESLIKVAKVHFKTTKQIHMSIEEKINKCPQKSEF